MDNEEPSQQPEIMTVEQAADFLGVHPQTVRNEIRAQRLPAKRIGKSWRLSRTALIEWLSTPEEDLERYSRRPRRTSPRDADLSSVDLAAEDKPTYDPGQP